MWSDGGNHMWDWGISRVITEGKENKDTGNKYLDRWNKDDWNVLSRDNDSGVS